MTVSPAAPTAPPKVSEFLLGVPLSGGLVTLCVVMLAGWLPHYLTWPWWPDLDAFAAIAQGWDAGIRPYRDVALFNFPGQIELFWLLGTSFGWGRTAPIYAVDAALLVVLGLVMSAWSRRSFGRSSPGLVGFVAFLHYYMSLDYAVVAQRDWQGPLLVVLGMMLVQVWPGLAGSMGSGLLFGLAFVIRPHVLLFTPAVALVVAMSASAGPASGGPGGRPHARIRALLAWAVAASMGAAVGFAPLAAQGLLGDFVRGVRQAGYGRYGEYPVSLAVKVIGQLGEPRLAMGSALAVAAAVVAPSQIRRLALPWVLMLVLVLVYRPLHPLPHAYLGAPAMADLVDQPGRDRRGGRDGVETAALAGAGVGRASSDARIARRPAVLRHGSQRASAWRPGAGDRAGACAAGGRRALRPRRPQFSVHLGPVPRGAGLPSPENWPAYPGREPVAQRSLSGAERHCRADLAAAG